MNPFASRRAPALFRRCSALARQRAVERHDDDCEAALRALSGVPPRRPMLIHLVRHGDYALLDRALGGRAPHSLSETGREQAERAAAALESCPIAAVVVSPVRRAVETAAPIAARLRQPVAIDPAFNEIDFADWTGRPFDALRHDPAWRAWNDFRSTAGVPGGETILAVQARAVAGILRLAERHADGEVAVICHADVIKVVLSHFLGAPLELMRRLEIAPGSISRVALHRDDAKITAVNHRP